MESILLVHTTGDWWESRYHYKQVYALKKAGYKVHHMLKEQDVLLAEDKDIILVTPKRLRITGGLSILKKVLKTNCKVIQICSLETLPLGIVLAIFFRKKVFYDCIEDHYYSLLHSKTNLPKFVRRIIAKFILFLEFLASKLFKGFIVSDPYLYQYHKRVKSTRKMIFYNMPPLRQFGKPNRNVEKKWDLIILGSMSIRTGVYDVVKAIKKLRDEGIVVSLKLIGDPYRDPDLSRELSKYIPEHKLGNQIHNTGKIPFYQVKKEMEECSVGVIPLLDLPKFQNNIAMKLWEYMALGLPVIASDLPPQRHFVKENVTGLFYPPGNIQILCEKIKNLLEDTSRVRTIGENGIDRIHIDWNSENQEKKYIDFYRKILNNADYEESELPPFL